MSDIMAFVFFAIGIVLVIKGGDWFVDAASNIAKAAKIPSFIIGATIVSFATTLPEMIVSIIASIQGQNDMAVGNAIGSVTANTGLIMAIAFLFMTVVTPRKSYIKQSVILLVTTVVLWIGTLSGVVSLRASIVLIIAFVAFMVINVKDAKKQPEGPDGAEQESFSKKDIVKSVILFLVGAAGIVIGSNMLIYGGSTIAEVLGVPERVIAVTMVAVGTSLPELITTITAIKKKESALSVGNIIGANIIDLALILPVCSFISGESFVVARQSLMIDFPACLAVSVLALIPMLVRQKASKVQGAIVLIVYIAYVVITTVI